MKNESEVLAAQDKLLDLPNTGSIWRHFKGGLYVVIATAIDEKTLNPVIVYRSLEYGHAWMRTYENWTELVEWPDGEMRHRFARHAVKHRFECTDSNEPGQF